MQVLSGRLVYSASDLNAYIECKHLVALNRLTASGDLERPTPAATSALIAAKGDLHERKYLDEMKSQYGDRLVAFEGSPEYGEASMIEAERRTVEAMDQGAAMIFQATFFDGQFYGRADFLRRVEIPSKRLAWSYEVIDTKLALSPKPYFLIQLCNYSEHLTRLLGTEPVSASIVLGSGVERIFRLQDYTAYYRHLKASFLSEVDAVGSTYPLPCKHCSVCTWSDPCEQQRVADDHLSLVAFMRGDQVEKLNASGLFTVEQLAAASDEQRPKTISEKSFGYLRSQAFEQNKQRLATLAELHPPYSYAFRPLLSGAGFEKLPQPQQGDVFFDIEGDPLFRPDRNLDYLFGFYLPDEDRYEAFWGLDFTQEREAFAEVIDFIVERRRRYPMMRVYHYAPYEKTAFSRLMGRYKLREIETNTLLRDGVLVDLYPIVRQALWVSQGSYGLKKLEKFYAGRRETETQGGDDSIVMFESWLETRDSKTLEDIRHYNEDDCRSTHGLRQWLVALRTEFSNQLDSPLEWPEYDPAGTSASDEELQRTELESELLVGVPEFESLPELRAASSDMRARWILGNIVQYHRRDRRPSWMEYFQRLEHPEELEDDRCALAGLELCEDIPSYKLSPGSKTFVYTYRFPIQEHYLGGAEVWWPYEKFAKAGDVVEIDDRERLLRIRLRASFANPGMLRAIIPAPDQMPINDKEECLAAISRAYLDGTLLDEHPATVDLLLAKNPSFRDRPAGSIVQPDVVTAMTVSERIAALDRSVLFIQGPPGTGKSTTGASAIVDLLQADKRVGLAAQSHSALHNLLAKIEEEAEKRHFRFKGAHKSSKTEGSRFTSALQAPMVEDAPKVTAFQDTSFRLFSGTDFAWACPDLVNDFDYVFIDEAGQMSIADALIISQGARNVVLLGDPLQLAQVAGGSHPTGCELSILEHMLGAHKTVPTDHGIFLDTSYRMHPAICEFISDGVYESRLGSDSRTANNRIDSSTFSGSGLVHMPIVHRSNSRWAAEEVEAIVTAIQELLADGTCTVREQGARPLRSSDILVVSPYNLQRVKIGERLADIGLNDVRVGTVNKFQGLEAPIVFYSMATSSGDDIPRDVGFLFETNRMNVAVSRAQCLSILVYSPALLRTACSTPDQMVLVNLLCAFVEKAKVWPSQYALAEASAA